MSKETTKREPREIINQIEINSINETKLKEQVDLLSASLLDFLAKETSSLSNDQLILMLFKLNPSHEFNFEELEALAEKVGIKKGELTHILHIDLAYHDLIEWTPDRKFKYIIQK